MTSDALARVDWFPNYLHVLVPKVLWDEHAVAGQNAYLSDPDADRNKEILDDLSVRMHAQEEAVTGALIAI